MFHFAILDNITIKFYYYEAISVFISFGAVLIL